MATTDEIIEKNPKAAKRYLPMALGATEVALGGLGAVPMAVGQAVRRIPAAVGGLMGAVPINPVDSGANPALDLAKEGIGEFKTGARNLATDIRGGVMGLLGLKDAPRVTPPVTAAPVATVPTSSGVTSAQLPQAGVNAPAPAGWMPKLLPETKRIVGGVQSQPTTQEFYRTSGTPEQGGVEATADDIRQRLQEETARTEFMTGIDRLVNEALTSEPKYSKSYYQDKDTGEWLMQEGKHYGAPKNKETLKYISDLLALKGGTVGGVTETNARRDVARLGLKGTETTAKLGLEGDKARAEALGKEYGLRDIREREKNAIERDKLFFEINKFARTNDLRDPLNIMKLAKELSPKKKVTTYDEMGNTTTTEEPDTASGLRLLKQMGFNVPEVRESAPQVKVPPGAKTGTYRGKRAYLLNGKYYDLTTGAEIR